MKKLEIQSNKKYPIKDLKNCQMLQDRRTELVWNYRRYGMSSFTAVSRRQLLHIREVLPSSKSS